MNVAIGFLIAVLVGLTGVGGGSFTTPILVLLCGISGAEAVGTALVFSTLIKLVAAPFFLAARKVHFRYLSLMLLGAIPGVLGGTYLLAVLRVRWNPVVLISIGTALLISAVVTLIYRKHPLLLRRHSDSWLPWVTLPIGLETGFSSAGAGTFGTLMLFNCFDIPAAQVVGTDILFSILLAATASIFHFRIGSVSGTLLKDLLIGGIPGVLLGCVLSAKVPSAKLKTFITVLTLFLGVQLVWAGGKLIGEPRASVQAADPR